MRDYKVTFLRGIFGNRTFIEYFKAKDIEELHKRVYSKYGSLLGVDKMRVIGVVDVS
jgi:hypothetical protein